MTDKKTIGLTSICIILFVVSSTTVILLNQRVNELQLELNQVFESENDRIILESQISDFQSKISDLETDKTVLQSQVSSLQSKITILKNEATQRYNDGYDYGKAEGYQKGVIDGAGSGYNIRDPTYAEAIAFITSDQTDKNLWTDNYVCMNFVADFKNNAFELGYRAGCVYIEFPDNIVHGISCFNTVDNGLVFVETQTDEIVSLTVGEVYYDRTIHDPPNFDDTVVHYVIIW